jgi:tetratricopeptide (TPR) repeat protein
VNRNQLRIDSLKDRLLQFAEIDTNKISILEELSFSYSLINPDEGIKYGLEAESSSSKIKWRRGIASANACLGLNYNRKCDYDKAVFHNTEAMKIYSELGDQSGNAGVLANMSQLYLAKSNYVKALEYGFKALSVYEHLQNFQQAAIVLENIGTCYLEQKDHAKTLLYYSKAYGYYKVSNNKRGMARSLGNQGIIYNEQGNFMKALEHHTAALKINESFGEMNSVQINLSNIGNTYSLLKDFQKSLEYHSRALKISKDIDDKRSIAINSGNIGEIYFLIAKEASGTEERNENLLKAVQYLKEATLICSEINFRGPFVEFSKYLTDTYTLLGDYKNAFEMHKEYVSARDSIFSLETKTKIINLETQRELELKNKNITLKDQQIEIEKLQATNRMKERVIYLFGITILLIIIFLLYRIYKLNSKEHKKIMSDIANIQSHQVRAPLARILGLIQLFNHEDASAEINRDIIRYVENSAIELDDVIKKVVNKTSSVKS